MYQTDVFFISSKYIFTNALTNAQPCVDIRSKPYGTEQLPLLFCVQLLKELCSPRSQRIIDDQSTLSNKYGNWRLPRIRHDPEIKMWSEKMRTELFLLSET